MRLYVSCISCIGCDISFELFYNFKRDTHLSRVSCIICVIRISCISSATPKALDLERPRIICVALVVLVVLVVLVLLFGEISCCLRHSCYLH